MAWSKLVDMELSDDGKLDNGYAPVTDMKSPKPDYPWGLRISLTHIELKKLGLDADCEIGDLIDLRAFAVVTSISKDSSSSGDSARVELQIQKIAVEQELEE
jgi:hypothetical protein